MMDLQPSDEAGGGGDVPFVHVISAFFGTDKVLGTKGTAIWTIRETLWINLG